MKTKSRKSRDIIKLVRPAIRGLAAYHIDVTPVRVKLDAMENPFLLPGTIRSEIGRAAAQAHINRYPDPSAKKLKQAIARVWKIDADRMLLGNGSDELIQAIILAFGGPVLTPMPTFAMYDRSPMSSTLTPTRSSRPRNGQRQRSSSSPAPTTRPGTASPLTRSERCLRRPMRSW
jgi:histidinol-phosphate/aromatic aminotransferase/cobyric acid decarboxylase-like protein